MHVSTSKGKIMQPMRQQPQTRLTNIQKLAYSNQYNKPENQEKGPIWFRYGESFKLHESQIVSTILSGCACNYTVHNDTKIVGYIVNRVYYKANY